MLLKSTRSLIGCMLVSGLAVTAGASDYDVSWTTMDSGGEMWTTGVDFELSGTIGQPDAGPVMTGGDFELTGGFWVVATAPVWCLGDADCSGGSPDFIDIEYFVAALSGETSWSAYYQQNHGGDPPPCPYLINDLNGGGVEFTDIQALVAHLGQPCDPL